MWLTIKKTIVTNKQPLISLCFYANAEINHLTEVDQANISTWKIVVENIPLNRKIGERQINRVNLLDNMWKVICKFKTPCNLCRVAHNNLPTSLRNDISEQKMSTIWLNEIEMVQHAGIHSNEFSISYTYIGVLLVIPCVMKQCFEAKKRIHIRTA